MTPPPPSHAPNRLIREKSPYLLQHAHNPVDWYPWGEDAFEKARREDKPLLLSVGYSTCHWCHVMERESFEDPAVAEVMNRNLVCIKLDREERPDVDKIYMTAVNALTGSGGWPLNVFLTPDLRPFYGGTYFPPDSRYGRPGWPQLVERIGELWRDPDQRKKLVESGDQLLEGLKRFLSQPREAADFRGNGPKTLDAAWDEFRGSFDAEHGGFSHAPKFPMPANLNFLFRYHAARRKTAPESSAEALRMTLETLRAMARGGIHDPLGGGFSRYSTDERWHVPHFEKMLYDNAQLAVNYLDAYRLTRDESFARTARGVLDYVLRDMTHPDGGFYSAEDADSFPTEGAAHKVEGAFYVWDKGELEARLTAPEAAAFARHYGVEAGGNVREDPHGEFPGKNVLYVAETVAETAHALAVSAEEADGLLESARKKLFDARAKRPRPHLDDKVITSWNGLMISAFAHGSQVLDSPAYLAAAVKAAEFLKSNLWVPGSQPGDAGRPERADDSRRLYRRWREGERGVNGTADDYAFLAQGLIDLYEASGDPRWLEWSIDLTEATLSLFYDKDNGGFFMTAEGHDKNLLLRVREEADNVEPSAASVAVTNLLRLAQFTDRKDFREAAEKTLRSFGAALEAQPRMLPQMLCALDLALAEPAQIVVTGDPAAEPTRALLREVRRRFLPNKILIVAGGAREAALSGRIPFLKDLVVSAKEPKALVCVHYACRLPVADPAALAEQLDGL
jgi:uncharacterized protein YyaL (SSP411 family)